MSEPPLEQRVLVAHAVAPQLALGLLDWVEHGHDYATAFVANGVALAAALVLAATASAALPPFQLDAAAALVRGFGAVHGAVCDGSASD